MIDVFIMDMGGHDANVEYLRTKLPHAKILRWTDHLSSMRRAAKQCRTRAFWLIASCCDYQDHDWLWEPVPWQAHQIHCWASGHQQFGDTFWVPLEQWNQQQESLTRLEQYQDVNFHSNGRTRLPWQTVIYHQDTIPQALQTISCHTPYVLFSDRAVDINHDAWLWREQPAVAFDTGRATSLIPRSAHGMIQDQVYDYPWLEQQIEVHQKPLDVIFISNGESCAEPHWQHLKAVMSDQNNRVVRIDGINGRAAAYCAAAEASETPWFFAVFAKLSVAMEFNWQWQPDRWQQPKHYIFHAYNPVTDLEYGHMAMIAYNRRLVMENTAHGLDFTLDQPHEVIPVLSGTAYYAEDAWTAWRTAFREALKLRHSLPDRQNQHRLEQWLSQGNTLHGAWSMLGAQDAIEYYDEVSGDFDALKKSYEWSWLASYAWLKHNLRPGQ